ncbi:MAG: alpha/beta fold hydrolase [Bryobacteraceae bacterium]
MAPFHPYFKNPHLATIAGNFWKRPVSEARWPVEPVLYRTEPDVQVLVHAQKPSAVARGEVVLIHGLEGSSESGYARSMAYGALERGYAVHRFNMRGCGGTEALSLMSYHAGQTSDLLHVVRERRRVSGAPVFVVGYSLGANVALKLAGELGEEAHGLLAGVAAVSAPIDLAACAEALRRPSNIIYQNRFLDRLKDRIRRKNLLSPDVYTLEHLPKVKSIMDFDDYYTARLFGFGTAANYFATQSSNQFLEGIRVPALAVIAKDDPMVPFRVYDHPAFARNPLIQLQPVEHGGHLGFISKVQPRFWLDETVLDWMEQQRP